ncbi:MAG TPA: hypothetical protein VGS79_08595 [Puia sp.]|nr:hypothetical protein [Puia sp.]
MSATSPWTSTEKIAFRIALIFFTVISLPNNPGWYSELIHFNWFRLNYRDLYDIARFDGGIAVSRTFFGSSLMGYATWLWTLVIAIVGATIWTAIVKARKTERREYNTLYYWLRVIVRYRAGIGIIGFGFTKLFPVQMPYPSLGVLNTNFGDLTAQKVFWLSVGIVPWYQVFAGVVECLAGTLLFFRRTTTIGAILLLAALGDIVYVNLAYDGGVHVYASYFVLLAGFLLVKDIPRIYHLLIRERVTIPVEHYPALGKPWQRWTRIGLKSATFFIFLILLTWLQYVNFRYDPYKQPAVAGVPTLRGNYIVSEFRINNVTIPYNPLDTIRWQDATFENWSSLTLSVNRPLPLELGNGGGAPQRDIERNFEISGVAGGRRVFHYYADTVEKVLYLEDKYKTPDSTRGRSGRGGNAKRTKGSTLAGQGESGADPASSAGTRGSRHSWISSEAWSHIGNEVDRINPLAASARRDKEYADPPKYEKRNRMILHYTTSDGSHIILTGIDDRKDSIYVVLDRNPNAYALSPSSLQAGSY